MIYLLYFWGILTGWNVMQRSYFSTCFPLKLYIWSFSCWEVSKSSWALDFFHISDVHHLKWACSAVDSKTQHPPCRRQGKSIIKPLRLLLVLLGTSEPQINRLLSLSSFHVKTSVRPLSFWEMRFGESAFPCEVKLSFYRETFLYIKTEMIQRSMRRAVGKDKSCQIHEKHVYSPEQITQISQPPWWTASCARKERTRRTGR